ncbi:MAG: hypothetical protein M3463_05365 [Verrucomicrobiota bacterium]|nr:hypothetical protein [Verrucomicrobiota bacterium]
MLAAAGHAGGDEGGEVFGDVRLGLAGERDELPNVLLAVFHHRQELQPHGFAEGDELENFIRDRAAFGFARHGIELRAGYAFLCL